jgi:RimJ/RimL family protein N-acetyltransferase
METATSGVCLGVLTTRPLEESDADQLRDLFTRLSPRTVYLRFFSPVKAPNDAALHHLANVDHDRRDAVAAVVDGQIVAVARYDRSREDPSKAEVAVVVEDAWQGQGVGTVVLTELAKRAEGRGVHLFTASVLGENQRMMALARHLGPLRTRLDHGEWELEIPLDAGVLTQVA